MKLMKNLALVAVAGAGLIGAPSVFAQCSTAAWTGGVAGGAVAGRPTDATPTSRYSGLCGLRAPAAGAMVTDNTPNAEQAYRARFYVFTGLTAGSALVFQARNAGGTQQIGVTYDATAGNFTFNTTGGSGTVGSIAQNAWYSVEVSWAKGTPPADTGQAANTMFVRVQGNSGNTAAGTPAATATITGVGAGDQIDDARLGWVSGGGTAGATPPTVDAFDSRRASAIGRLCRGDANNSNSITAGDRTAITTELGGTLASGQPDCNESGTITAGDRTCVTNLLAAGASCS